MNTCWQIDIFEDQELVQDFLCCIGKGVLNNPVLDTCGHSYCQVCFDKQNEFSELCPISQQIIKKDEVTKNLIAQNMIEQMNVVCLYKEKKCLWKGILQDLNQHLGNDCEYVEIECTNEECIEKIQRRNIKAHEETCMKKKIQCSDCNEFILKKNIQNHKDDCQEALIECLNNCGERILRRDLEYHSQNECSNVQMQCPFNKCTVRGNRKTITTHVFSKNGFIQHQDFISAQVFKMEEELKKMKNYFQNEEKKIKQENFIRDINIRGQGKFIPQQQSKNVVIDYDLKSAVKINNPQPIFCIVNDNIMNKNQFFFKLNCINEIGIGFCCPDAIKEHKYIFSEKERIRDCYLFKITPQITNEIVIVKIFYEPKQQQLALLNLNNNALTYINFSPNSNKNINPVIIFYEVGDSVQLINENEIEKEEDLFNMTN